MAVGISGRGTIHIDKALTNIAVEYRNTALIASQVLPSVPVDKQSDKYYTFGKENFMLDQDIRADKAPSKRVNSYTASDSSYYCERHALSDAVSLSERSNADAVINPDVRVTKRLIDKILLRYEYDTAAYLFNTTTFSGYTSAVSNGWDDYTNGDPAGDVDTAKSNIQKATGIAANTIIMGKEVYDKVKRHSDVVDAFKYTSKGIITPQMLAEFFQIEKVLVGGATYNSANEGATESMSYLWGKYALIAYVPNSPAIDEPSMGYTFEWRQFCGKTAKVKKWYDNDIDADIIEAEKAYDIVVTAASAGYLLSSVVS